MDKHIIGYGSFFHRDDATEVLNFTAAPLFDEYQLFYAGRYAIKYVLDAIMAQKEIQTIWLPQYYCPFVKNWLEHNFGIIAYYNIDPFDPDAQIDYTLFNPETHLILVNNYWGLKENRIPQGKRPLIIEDHSHGWLTQGCRESRADFCIASLRKTLPIPLGGIAWKPQKSTCTLALPKLTAIPADEVTNAMHQSWNNMELALEKKSVCKAHEDKNEFLTLYNEGEQLLRNTHRIYSLTPNHKEKVERYLWKDFTGYKAKNLAYIQSLLNPTPHFKILDTVDRIPFGLLVLFTKRETLVAVKQFLISKAIYPAELWPENDIHYDYKFLLNIHIDFRYNPKDLDYLAQSLNSWIALN